MLSLFVGLVVVSCSSEPFSGLKVANKSLISITRNQYIADSSGDLGLPNQVRIDFLADKPISIQYLGGHDEFEYKSGLLYKWLSFTNQTNQNKLVSTIIYSYDNNGRITRIEINPATPPIQGDSAKNVTIYTDNQIISTWSIKNGFYKKTILTLDKNDEIIKEEVSLWDGSTSTTFYSYINKNLISCEISSSGSKNVELRTFAYSDKTNKYNNYYKKLFFGAEWRNNSALDFPDNILDAPFFNFSIFKQSVYPQVSEKLISNYSTSDVSVLTSYTFDNQDDLKSQTEDYSFSNGQKMRIISSFNYSNEPK